MEALYSILPIAGRFVLATALLVLLYWSVWRKQATYRAKRAYLITMPTVAIIISLLQVEVYKPEPIVVEVTSNELQAASESLTYSPLHDLFPREGVNSAEPLTASSEAKTMHTESATYAAGSDTSLPSHEEDTEWGLTLTGIAYTLIILALFSPFAFSLYQVRRLRREVSVRKDDNEHDIHVLMGSVVKAPFSFYRTIFMPLALTEAQRRMIMEHERAHILHRHYIDVWVSETVTRLLWWNPFLWWARAELRNVHEFEADSEVLATGEDVLAYQTILIEEVLHGDVIIANGFNHSFIRRRFVEMLQSTNRRMTSMAKAGTAAWMLLVIALMCCTVGEAETVYKVKSDELQVTIDGAFNTGEKVVRFNHRYVVEKDLDKRDSLMWAHAYSIPADFNISIGMKSKEEQKLFERFMMIWSIIVDHNGLLERGEIPTHESLTEEEERNGIVKAKELYREKLMQTLSQIDAPLHDTLNLFLEKFGLDFVLPKGKDFRVRYKTHNGEPAFFTKSEQKKETVPADSGQWHQAKVINPRDYLPEVLSQIGNLNADVVVQLLSTAASVQELTPEQYEELKKTMPNKNLPSLDSINSNAREIKKAIETIMLEGMTGMQTAIVNNIREAALKPGEVVNVPMTTFEESFDTTFTVETSWVEEVVIDNSFEAQNKALLRFIANWFELSENGVFLSKSEYEKKNIDMEEYPSYEEYSKNWNTNIVLETQLLSRYLNKLNSELRPQVEALLKEHGWIIPRDKDLYITIRSDAFNKTWTFKKRPRSSGITVGPLTEQEILRMKEDAASKINKQLFMCFTSWGLYYSPNISGVTTDEYKIAKKIQPDLPKASEVNQSKELTWTVKQLYIEHLLKDVNEGVANQVRNVIKKYSTDDYLGKDLYFTIDLGTHEIHVKKEKGKELTSQFLWEKGKPLPEGFLPSEKNKAATNTSANEPAITNDASLREQDEALQAFFRGWFDMNKSSQEPMLTEEEFQQAIKTEPIPPGFDPSYKAYKERTKNFIAEAKKKMEEGRARLNKEIRPQVEAVLKQHGMQFPPERQLKIIIRAAYKNATWEFENTTHPNAYGCAVNKNFLIVDDPSSPDYNEKKDFISPQWGLELPEGYVRLTDYKKLTETDATAKAQYNQLMSCFRNAQALRKEALTNAYKEKHPRYVSVEEATMAGIKKLFRNAGIEMLEKGAYRLPDGTIVMEDDQHNLVPQSVDYQQGTTDRDPRLCNKAPRMERDKSPNYSPFNEQTWPVYTNVQTIDLETYNNQPQVFRGKDCTYVVEHFPITYDLHWFYTSTQDKLVDTKTGDQYMKRYTEHLHMNNYMWIHGMEGKVIRLISIYPPLPKNVTSVDFIPSRIPDEIRLSNAAPLKEYKKLKVQELEQMEKVVY